MRNFYAGRIYRVLSFSFGLFLVAVGVYGAFSFTEAPGIWRIGGGLLFVVFGFNMAYSAWKAKESWVSKIGPLP